MRGLKTSNKRLRGRRFPVTIAAGVACAGTVLCGCGGKTLTDSGGVAGSGPVDDGGSSGSGGTTGAGGATGQDCSALSAALEAKLSGADGCTTIVRLDYQTRVTLGYQIVCGPYQATSEADARATAMADTGHGSQAQSLSGASPADEYVFYEMPMDFGGVGVVSARTGLSVFGASIVWMGRGDISYPTSWQPAGELGSGCIQHIDAPVPAARGFNLDSTKSLSSSELDPVVHEVWSTALPEALHGAGTVLDAMVLLYPRSEGAFQPESAEWVVMINSSGLP